MIFDKGRYFSLLNPSADKNKVCNFHSGGILPENSLEPISFGGKIYSGRRKEHSFSQLAEFLKIATQSRLCCYFEDLLHQRKDPIAAQFKEETLYYQEEPYLFLKDTDFSITRANQMISYVNAQWHYMNIISKEQPDPILNITYEKLEKIALGTTAIVLGAYDMEGFVIWMKE
jgi:hypothetical protein